MNNKIKFSLLILAAVATTSLAVFKMKKTEIKFSENKEIENEAKEERAEFEGAANWWNNMRENQNTHSIDLADIINARKDADLNSNKSERSLSLNWEEMGPDNVGGRTRAILFDNANPNHVFAGGVSGGMWESQNLGQSWVRINGFDDKTIWDNQNISCITQANNGDIYVGTGEYFGFFETPVISGGTGFPGDGIWRSSDHGATWAHVKSISSGSYNPTTSNAWSFVTGMASGGAVHPSRVYASIKGGGPVSGIQYWEDGMTAWENVTGPTGAPLTGVGADVKVSSNGTVHAVVGNKYYHSDPASSDPSTKLTSLNITGLPSAGSIVRMGVAVAPSNPNYVYVIASYGSSTGEVLKGVYQSTDGGNTFTQIGATQTSNNSVNWSPVTQGSYALAIGVLPSDENVVFIGGIDCYKYQMQGTGGYGWNKITNWGFSPWYSLYVHADIHAFVFHPTNPNIMLVGSDGGMSITTNAGSHQPYFGTRNLGYNVTQFYSCDAREYSGIYVAGAQDNGNFRVDFTGNTTKTGVEIKGGDGGDIQVSKVNPNAIFAEYVGGNIARSSNNGQSFLGFFDAHIDAGPGAPDGEPDDLAAFIAPMLLWENISGASNINEYSKYYLGTGSGVWMTKQAMNFSVTPVWFKIANMSGGPVISLAVSNNGKTLFAGTQNGNLYRVDGLDTTFAYDTNDVFNPIDVSVTTTLIHSFGRFITGITVDKNDANHIVVVLGNYGNTDYVYESNDALSVTPTLTNITGTGLPKMPVYCSSIDPTNPNIIIIGSELGLWATENGGSTWSEQNNSMARVPVTKLRQIPVGNYLNVIYASTYGNGVWRTFSNSVLSTKEPLAISSELKVYPNPASDELNFVSQLSWGNTDVTANLIDMSGRIVSSIDFGKYSMGVYTFKMNVSDLSNGNYLLQVVSGGSQSVSKVVVAR